MGDRGENRWVDAAWHRDWLFWLGVVLATLNLVLLVVRRDPRWWTLPFSWLLTFGFTVALVGFVRTVYRTYRAP